MVIARDDVRVARFAAFRTAEELIAAEFGLTKEMVDTQWPKIVEDLHREEKHTGNADSGSWTPSFRDQVRYIHAIYLATGSPVVGARVSVESVRLPVMKAAHTPGSDRMRELGLSPGHDAQIMYCSVTVQQEMTRDLIRGFGATPV